jgi:flagellar basal body-associated protein FliL
MSPEVTGAQGDEVGNLRAEVARLRQELEEGRPTGRWGRLFGRTASETTEQTRERMRGLIATSLIRLLIVLVVAIFAYLWWLSRAFSDLTPDQLITVIPMVGTTLLTPIVGLIGAVSGFYYGGQTAAQAADQAAQATQATQEATQAVATQAASEAARAVTEAGQSGGGRPEAPEGRQ